MPTYLDVFHVYLLGSAEAAVAVLNARNDDALKNQKMDVLLGAISAPPKMDALQSRRAKYLGVPGQAKTVTEFIQSTETKLRGALKVALDLVKQHAPDELPPEPADPSVKRVAGIPTDVASVPSNDPTPFATIATPLDKMFWPIITDDTQAMVVSYLNTDGKIVGEGGSSLFCRSARRSSTSCGYGYLLSRRRRRRCMCARQDRGILQLLSGGRRPAIGFQANGEVHL